MTTRAGDQFHGLPVHGFDPDDVHGSAEALCPTCNGPVSHPLRFMRRHPLFGNPDTPEHCLNVYERIIQWRDSEDDPEQKRLLTLLIEGWRLT
jgi:hypothetical protein